MTFILWAVAKRSCIDVFYVTLVSGIQSQAQIVKYWDNFCLGCLSILDWILQLESGSTREIYTNLYIKEFPKCHRTYFTGIHLTILNTYSEHVAIKRIIEL